MKKLTTRTDWPINGSELTRRLGLEVNMHNVTKVRTHLKSIGCPRAGVRHRPPFVVYQEQAEKVAVRMGRTLQ